MTLLPQVRSQLDDAAHLQATRPRRAQIARITNAMPARRSPTLGGVISAVAAVVALGIGAGAIVLLNHHHKAANAPGSPQTSTSPAVRSIERFAASQFAVFARPQTAKDQSLPAVVRRAVSLGGLGPGFQDVLNGVIPSLTRYTQALPDGREIFLTVPNPASTFPGRAHRNLPPVARTGLNLGPVIVQPDGKWINGPPVLNARGGYTARDAYITARAGRQACGLDTYWVIVPNQVARIRWQFGHQDPMGYVFNAPLTVNMTVRCNVAATTIPQRASCDRPAAVTLYGQNGQVLSQTGDGSNLTRITRPVRHGNPFAYKRLFFHRPGPHTTKR
jgi:hypothetical protein